MKLIKWFRQGDQLKHWLKQEWMTAYDYISDTDCISDKSKSCVRIKAHVLDTGEHDGSAGGRRAVGEQASAFPASSPLKFQDSIWFFFSLQRVKGTDCFANWSSFTEL